MATQGQTVAELTVPVHGDLTPLRNDLAQARRELESFNKSLSGGSGSRMSFGGASAAMSKLQSSMRAANDNAVQLAKSLTTVSIAEESIERMTQSLIAAMGQFAASGAADTATMSARIAELEKQVSMLNTELEKLKVPPLPTSSFDQLRMKIDSVYAASVKYETELGDINRALQQNIINGRQASVMVDQLNASYTNASSSMRKSNDLVDKASGVTKNLAWQQRNLSFQLLDTGQSLALGMPPLMVLLQQGPQIAQIWGTNEGGIGRAFSESGKMILGLITKFPLLTAAAAIGAVTVFKLKNELVDAGHKSIEFGDIMSGLWKTVKDGVSDAFSPLMDTLKPVWDWIVDATVATGNLIIKSFTDVYNDLKYIFKQIPNVVALGIAGATNMVIDGINGMISYALDGINKLSAAINGVLSKIPGYDASQDALGMIDPKNYQIEDRANTDKIVADMKAQLDARNKRHDEIENSDPLGEFYDAWKANSVEAMNERLSKKKKKGAKEKEDPYEKIIRDSKQFIEQQNLEAEAIGMTEQAAAALRYEQEMLNKAADAHIKLTQQQKEEIHGLAEQMAEAEQRTKDLKAAYDFGKDTFKGFFTDLKDGLIEGKSLWESFANAASNALQKIADKLLDSALDGLFDGLWNAGGTGGGGGILGGLFSWITGGHASGTSYSSGGWKMVGEKGPELMKVPGGSQVVPNNRIAVPSTPTFAPAANDNRGGVTIVQHLSANGDETIKKIAYDAVIDGLDDYDTHKLPQSMQRVQENPRIR
jgi:hypothetical protein